MVDDGCEGLWRIHDGLYDLGGWENKHPGKQMIFVRFNNYIEGGADWILLTKGTDITEPFETSHAFGVSAKMLKKFWVKEAKMPRKVR